MLTSIFFDVMRNVWPMIFIFTIIVVSLRITYLIYNKEKFVLYKEFLMFCFIIYILLLYYIVTFQDNSYGTNNFIPFKEIFRYNFKSSLFIKNVLGNVLLFIPFGVFVTHFVKNKRLWPTLILSVLRSGSIEFSQSVIGRTADIDDVILNMVGGMTGYFLYRSGDAFISSLPKFMKKQLFWDIFSLLFIIVIIYLAFRFEFWRIIA